MSQEDRQTLLDKTATCCRVIEAREDRGACRLARTARIRCRASPAPCDFYSGGLGVSLVDPVPQLLNINRQRITTVTGDLATKGRLVMESAQTA